MEMLLTTYLSPSPPSPLSTTLVFCMERKTGKCWFGFRFRFGGSSCMRHAKKQIVYYFNSVGKQLSRSRRRCRRVFQLLYKLFSRNSSRGQLRAALRFGAWRYFVSIWKAFSSWRNKTFRAKTAIKENLSAVRFVLGFLRPNETAKVQSGKGT